MGRGLGIFWSCLFLFYSAECQGLGLIQVEGMCQLTELLFGHSDLYAVLQSGDEFGKIQMSTGCKISSGKR